MAATIRGFVEGFSAEWFPAGGNAPRRGDVIFMKLPDEAPTPPYYARVDGGCWKWSDGTEMGFPYPAVWFYLEEGS